MRPQKHKQNSLKSCLVEDESDFGVERSDLSPTKQHRIIWGINPLSETVFHQLAHFYTNGSVILNSPDLSTYLIRFV